MFKIFSLPIELGRVIMIAITEWTFGILWTVFVFIPFLILAIAACVYVWDIGGEVAKVDAYHLHGRLLQVFILSVLILFLLAIISIFSNLEENGNIEEQ